MDKHFEATVVGLRVLGSSAVSGWMASITMPVERGVFRRPVLAILAVGTALSLIGVTAAVVMGRRISRPIEALSD